MVKALPPASPLLKDEILSAADVIDDRYEVLSVLGRGGMGSVYEVKDRQLQKTFAMKVLRPELVSDRVVNKRFEQEMKAANSLNHANLVAVYGHGKSTTGISYFVMEYVDGESLAKLIAREGHLGTVLAVDIFKQVCDGLTHAHQKGLIHRDLKPSNIILTKTESGAISVKIIDFGIAKVVSAQAENKLTRTEEIFGSPQYMSPEQCQGDDLDARSDIYSLGCVMYEAITGRAPFVGESPIQVIVQHLNKLPVPLDIACGDRHVDKGLQDIVMRCLEKQPKDRYQSASELQKDLSLLQVGKLPKVNAYQIRKQLFKGSLWSNVLTDCAVLSAILGCGLMIYGYSWYNQLSQYDVRPSIASRPLDAAIRWLRLPGQNKALLSECLRRRAECDLESGKTEESVLRADFDLNEAAQAAESLRSNDKESPQAFAAFTEFSLFNANSLFYAIEHDLAEAYQRLGSRINAEHAYQRASEFTYKWNKFHKFHDGLNRADVDIEIHDDRLSWSLENYSKFLAKFGDKAKSEQVNALALRYSEEGKEYNSASSIVENAWLRPGTITSFDDILSKFYEKQQRCRDALRAPKLLGSKFDMTRCWLLESLTEHSERIADNIALGGYFAEADKVLQKDGRSLLERAAKFDDYSAGFKWRGYIDKEIEAHDFAQTLRAKARQF
jgi:serine/threonine protein kinase